MPRRTAFTSWRQIGAFGVAARVAKPHRYNRDARRIIELLTGQAYPAAQTVARRVIERRASGVDARSRRLASDQQAGAGRNLQNRPWFVRQRGAEGPFDANAAGANAPNQRVEVLGCGQGQAEALGRAATAARQRAKCARSSGNAIRAGRAKSAATIAVISAMENASPARKDRAANSLSRNRAKFIARVRFGSTNCSICGCSISFIAGWLCRKANAIGKKNSSSARRCHISTLAFSRPLRPNNGGSG